MAKRHEMAREALGCVEGCHDPMCKDRATRMAALLRRFEREALLKAIDAADDERDPNDSHWNKCVDNIKARIRALLEDS